MKSLRSTLALLCGFAFAGPPLARAQILDTNFNPSPSSDVYALALQPDGKILVGGSFSRIAAVARANLARLNANGTYDTTFDLPVTGLVYAIVVQPDGKILVGGGMTLVAGQNRGRLVRLNPDGSVDVSFTPAVTGNTVRAIILQPDGKIVVGGDITAVGGRTRFGLARLQPDGSLDPTLVPEATGTTSPTASAGVFALVRQPDGRIVVGGQFTTLGGELRRGLGRINADGTLDPGLPSLSGNIVALGLQRDGKILVGGSFPVPGPFLAANIARLNPAGDVDFTFAATAVSPPRAFAEQTDGKLVVGGIFTNFAGVPRSFLVRLQPDGRPDDTFPFEGSGILNTTPGVYALAASADGQFLVGGSFTQIAGQARSGLARFVPPTPQFITSPAASFATIGTAITLTATVAGTSPTYQWRKDGVALPGATLASLTLPNARPSDAGLYDLVATNSFGSATSNAARLTVGTAPLIITPPFATVAVAGQSANFYVVTSATPEPTFQWQRNGLALPGATTGSLTLPAVSMSDAGNYTCVVTNPFGSTTSAAALLTVLPAARLTNLSVRTNLDSTQALIVGYVVGGGNTEVLVRAAGPSLAAFGIAPAMTDPRVELYQASTKILENDNWPSILSGTFAASGAFPFSLNSKDAALLYPSAGAYSVLTTGASSGIVLVEAYDTGTAGSARLVNVSARNHVGTDANILIAGFTLTGGGTKRILLRAVGPTLGGVPFNVPGVLADPVLALYDAGGAKLAENDNWNAALSPTFAAAGAFALAPASRDSALLVILPAGGYTVQVSGVANTTGVALVEVYEVP